jgi:hypothetical protein
VSDAETLHAALLAAAEEYWDTEKKAGKRKMPGRDRAIYYFLSKCPTTQIAGKVIEKLSQYGVSLSHSDVLLFVEETNGKSGMDAAGGGTGG